MSSKCRRQELCGGTGGYSGRFSDKNTGFPNIFSHWNALNYEEETIVSEDAKFTEQECHRKFAAGLFNYTWKLLEKTGRSEDENEEMIQAAYASCYHWRHVGAPVNQARGEWMISHVLIMLGRGSESLHHARRSLAICDTHNFGDFDRAYACEAMARASAAVGNKADFEKYHRLATEAASAIKEEEDRELFTRDLQSGPWFGMN